MNTTTLPRALLPALVAAAGSLLVIPAFAAQRNLVASSKGTPEVVTPSGVHYRDLARGQGNEAVPGKIVEVHYVGWLEDGTKFDSSCTRSHAFTFRLGAGDALKGWDEGLVGMKVGGKRRLVIPPALGFGKQGIGSVVPPNSILVYEFELLAVR